MQRLRFDRFELLPDARQLSRDGEVLPLGGRAFDLLLHLVRHRDRVVSKQELMDAVWPGLEVVENNLNAQVAAVRRAIGEDAILTVTGRGYRFVGAPVVPDSTPAPATVTAPAPAAGGRAELRASIAVLPFQNMSGDPEQGYFADGMTEDILTALARFRQLVVISRNSSFAFRDRPVDIRTVGSTLGARYVLEGSVRKVGRRVRLTGQLIDTRDGSHLWADAFDGDLEDVFELQDRITARVVAAIEPAIRKSEIEAARRKHPESLDAHDLYLRALPHLYAMRPDDNRAAQALLEDALARDPDNALALAGAAWCYEQRLSRHWPGADDAQAERSVALARRALALGGDDPAVAGHAGFVMVMVGREFEPGLAALRTAVAANPHHALLLNFAGTAELIAGDLDAALAHLDRAHRLNPSDPAAFMILAGQACVHFLQGRPARALELAVEAAARYPDWDFTWMVLGAAAIREGDATLAGQAVANLTRVLPNAALSHPISKVFRDTARRDALIDALRDAGLPEHPAGSD